MIKIFQSDRMFVRVISSVSRESEIPVRYSTKLVDAESAEPYSAHGVCRDVSSGYIIITVARISMYAVANNTVLCTFIYSVAITVITIIVVIIVIIIFFKHPRTCIETQLSDT